MKDWPLQDALNKFSELVSAVLAGQPQQVTLQDKSSVVILSVEEYGRLRKLEESHLPSFGGLLLEIPQDDSELDRPSNTPRAPEE